MITKDEALADLREIFPVGTEVRTILRHASRSGMTRAISVISPGLRDVSYLVSRVTGFKMDPKHEGLKVGGCGMDMGYHVVYSLSRALYRDAGYALRHRWLWPAGSGPQALPHHATRRRVA